MRTVHGYVDRRPADMLEAAAQWCRENDVAYDLYGTGEVIEAFERKIARLTGFDAARFMPSGVMAQNIMLRVWADDAGINHVGMHPTSHLELHEERAYSHLHGLNVTLVGPADRPLLAEDLLRVKEPLAALLIELPIREAGGQLPTWDQLTELAAVAEEQGIPLHLDGARLWECGPAYQRSYAEICAPFASAYVSFYKGVGALSGAMLLGDVEEIERAAVWQRRQGGTLWSQIASVATAAMRFDDAIARMPETLAHAKALAAAIAEVPGVRILPDPPHTCMFHIIAELDVTEAVKARTRVLEQTGIKAFGGARPGPLPGTFRTEVYVTTDSLEVSPEEARKAWGRLLHP